VTRKGSGSIHVDFNGISILGTIQPDKLPPMLAGANDGLVPRLLWAWPDKLPPAIPDKLADLDGLESIYRRLETLSWGRGADETAVALVVPLASLASQVFHVWEVDNARGESDAGSLYETFAGKMSGTVLRLALVAEYSLWAFTGGAEPVEVSARSISAAIRWVEDYAKPMAQRVYGDATVSEVDRNASLLARYIVRLGQDTLNMRELRQSPHKRALKPLLKSGAMEAAFAVLEDCNWLAADPSRSGNVPGQPRKDYRVNPEVLGRSV
jgi:hypothetical protein